MTSAQRTTATGTAIAFVALTIFVWTRPPVIGDARIAHRLLSQPGSVGWNVATAVSFVASATVVAVVGIVIASLTAWRRRDPVVGIAIVAAPALGALAEVVMKVLVGRPQPITAALSGESGNGYPSGHATGFAALAVAVLVVWVLQPDDRTTAERRTATTATGLAIALVAWARVAVGAHYPSDTIGGALLGITVGLVCPALRRARQDLALPRGLRAPRRSP